MYKGIKNNSITHFCKFRLIIKITNVIISVLCIEINSVKVKNENETLKVYELIAELQSQKSRDNYYIDFVPITFPMRIIQN